MTENTDPAPTAEKDALAFCEPVSATVRSREHIRIVGPEGFKYGGGIPNDALCGANVRRGWDQCVPVHPSRFAPNAETNPTCQACIDAYYARVIPPGKTDPSDPAHGDRPPIDGCGCFACIGDKPVSEGSWLTVGMSRMIVCAACGNKRCPHGTDHRNACTGSNEPGQAGSRYGPGGRRYGAHGSDHNPHPCEEGCPACPPPVSRGR